MAKHAYVRNKNEVLTPLISRFSVMSIYWSTNFVCPYSGLQEGWQYRTFNRREAERCDGALDGNAAMDGNRLATACDRIRRLHGGRGRGLQLELK